MTAEQTLLLLQLGDSGFPSGGFAFSWGLEGLAQAGYVTGPADLSDYLADLVANRWHGFDRVALVRAHAATGHAALSALDREVETATLAAPLRDGSKRAGRALLSVHARLGGAALRDYRTEVLGDPELGHLAVVQGLVWREAGLGPAAAEALGLWSMLQGIATAAVRLGLVGHLEAQAVLARARAVAAPLLSGPAPARLTGFTPLADIAMITHARRDARLFAT